jgi:hypothetical protein
MIVSAKYCNASESSVSVNTTDMGEVIVPLAENDTTGVRPALLAWMEENEPEPFSYP